MRNRILCGAQKLFQEKGLGKITMEDIANFIGKGKSTLYYYFKSKEDIFSAVLDMEINEIIIEAIRQMSQCSTFLEKLETFGRVKYDMTRKRKTLYATMERFTAPEEMQQYYLIKSNVHLKYVQQEKIALLPVFLEAISQNIIKKLDDEALDTTILVFLCSLRGLNREVYLHGRSEDAIRLIRVQCEIFYRGIS
jgi:Transcriptional regulator